MSGSGEEEVEKVDFTQILLSFSGMILTDLSESKLEMAKQGVEMLSVLEEKTQGNLNGDEERLLCQMLSDLQARLEQQSAKG